MRFQVLIAALLKIQIFGDVTPCFLAELFKTFRSIVLPSFLGWSSSRVLPLETSVNAPRHSTKSQRTRIFVLFQFWQSFKENEIDFKECHPVFYSYIHGSVHRDSILIRSNKMQQYSGIYLLQNYSTCFGCPSHPSSGVHKTVTVASGTGHSIWATTFFHRGL